jgi:hypothetical protein
MLHRMHVIVVAEGPTMDGVIASMIGFQSQTPGVAITIERQVIRHGTPPRDEDMEDMLRGILDQGSSL